MHCALRELELRTYHEYPMARLSAIRETSRSKGPNPLLGPLGASVQKVLIVDDNAYVRKSLRWTIEHELEWQVCGEAANGAEGVSAATQMKPDIVVLDLSMPVMNGIEAARQLRRLVPRTHLLMFTSYVTPTLEEAARDVGIEAFVAKSEGAPMLLQSLRRLASSPGTSTVI
jgi:DNA-binding NarL/FixJ family response regulator